MVDVKISQLPTQSPASRAAGAALWTHKGHIEGNKMVWLSGSGLRLTSGSTYIPSLGYAIDAPTDIDKTGLVLAPSTWHHLYRHVNAGVPDFEIVTTVPAAPYSGTARSKTGDTSRRYVGSVKTDGSGNVLKFTHSTLTGDIIYARGTLNALLAAGTATTSTPVDASAFVPLTSTIALARFVNTANVGPNLAVAHGDNDAITESFMAIAGGVNLSMICPVPTNAAQLINYAMTSAPSAGGGYIQVCGYTYER